MACFRSGRCISGKEKVKPFRNITYLSATFSVAISFFCFFFYLSTSHAFLPPPLSQFVSVSPITRSQREVKAACAIASALYSLCPTTSRSVSDKTWPCGQCFHSADSPWRKKKPNMSIHRGTWRKQNWLQTPRGRFYPIWVQRRSTRTFLCAGEEKKKKIFWCHSLTRWLTELLISSPRFGSTTRATNTFKPALGFFFPRCCICV